MAFFKKWNVGLTFDKVLLTAMFIGTVALCVHLMNKSDAGNDEMAFLVWAQTQAAIVLGALLALIKSDTGPPAATPAATTPPVEVGPPAPPIEPPKATAA